MSLRLKLLSLFGAFAVAPLVALGLLGYARALDARAQLVGGQAAVVASSSRSCRSAAG
jgi:hypothetical protein